MEIRFYVIGAERKAFATVVGGLIGWEPVYKKAPTFAYAVSCYIIDKNGTLIFSDDADMGEAAQILSALTEHGCVSGDSLPTAVSLGEDTDEAVANADVLEDAPVTAFPEQVHDALDRLSIELP